MSSSSFQKPAICRMVHYVSEGSPVRGDGTQKYVSACRAATVTEVHDDHTVSLFVMNPTGLFFPDRVPYDGGGEVPGKDCPNPEAHGDPFRYCACGWIEGSHRGGTWHWPERAGQP